MLLSVHNEYDDGILKFRSLAAFQYSKIVGTEIEIERQRKILYYED